MKKIFPIILFFIPLVSFAQAPSSYKGLIELLIGFLPTLVLIIGMIILLYFVWRTATFILTAGGPDTREKAKRHFLWGILALFVTLTLYGIISFILNEFGFGDAQIPTL